MLHVMAVYGHGIFEHMVISVIVESCQVTVFKVTVVNHHNLSDDSTTKLECQRMERGVAEFNSLTPWNKRKLTDMLVHITGFPMKAWIIIKSL